MMKIEYSSDNGSAGEYRYSVGVTITNENGDIVFDDIIADYSCSSHDARYTVEMIEEKFGVKLDEDKLYELSKSARKVCEYGEAEVQALEMLDEYSDCEVFVKIYPRDFANEFGFYAVKSEFVAKLGPKIKKLTRDETLSELVAGLTDPAASASWLSCHATEISGYFYPQL